MLNVQPDVLQLSPHEIALWSACVGIYISYATLSSFYAAYHRSLPALQTSFFVVVAGLFVVINSGLATQLGPKLLTTHISVLLLISGPLAGLVASTGLRAFLRAEQRDKVIDRGMQVVMGGNLALLLLLLWPHRLQALEYSALGVSLCALGAFWLTVRARLLGQHLALPMAIATAAMVFAVLGLYANALGILSNSLGLQVFTALCAAVYVVVCSHTLRRRNAEYLRMRRALSMSRDKDLVTQTWTGAALIRLVDDAIVRAKRNRKEMAVICIQLTNDSQLRQQFGANGQEQVIYALSARIRQVANAGNHAVGRYGDNSFVVVVDALKQASMLRTLGLRLAVAVRRPFVVNPMSSSPVEFRADVGVGVARISLGRELGKRKRANDTEMGGFDSFSVAQDALHEAAELAIEARNFRSCAAITDAYTRKTVALEEAKFK